MKTVLAMLSLLLVLLSIPARAEIIKSAIPCRTGKCLYWWPQAPAPAGWHQDREASDANGINILIPDGTTFTDAETVIYAKALYKPLAVTITTLARLIEQDRQDFLAREPKLSITPAAPLSTGDGSLLQSYTFSPAIDGNWEEVGYGEEGDFFLIFTVSSRTRQGLAGAAAAFRKFIVSYQEKP
jgi:hypothetical protein